MEHTLLYKGLNHLTMYYTEELVCTAPEMEKKQQFLVMCIIKILIFVSFQVQDYFIGDYR